MLDLLCGQLFMYCTLDTSSLELNEAFAIIQLTLRHVLWARRPGILQVELWHRVSFTEWLIHHTWWRLELTIAEGRLLSVHNSTTKPPLVWLSLFAWSISFSLSSYYSFSCFSLSLSLFLSLSPWIFCFPLIIVIRYCFYDNHPITGRDIQCRAPNSRSRYTTPIRWYYY